jgi:hypothetical protein
MSHEKCVAAFDKTLTDLRAEGIHTAFILAALTEISGPARRKGKLVAGMDHASTEMHAWLDMAINVIAKTGFPLGLDKAGLTKAFIAQLPEFASVIGPRKRIGRDFCKFALSAKRK